MKNRYKHYKKEKGYLFILLFSMLLGSVIGSLYSRVNPTDIVGNINLKGSDFTLFAKSFLRYNITLLFIWLLAFIKPCLPFLSLTLLIKGIGYSLSTGGLVNNLGAKGLLYCLCLYLPQNIILIFLYFFASIIAISYNKKEINLKKYFEVLPIYIFILCVTSFIEVYLTPVLLNLLTT